MKKHEILFLFIFIIIAFFITKIKQEQIKLEDFEVKMETKLEISCIGVSYPVTVLYPHALSFGESHLEINKAGEKFGLTFHSYGQDYLYDYDIRTIKSPFPNYKNYKPIFYNIPITSHKIIPDLIDKEHKIAIIYQKYNMYHIIEELEDKNFIEFEELEDEDSVEILPARIMVSDGKKIRPATKDDDIPIYNTKEDEYFFNVEEEILDESTVRKENKFFQDLIENADSSTKVKKPFQNQDNYTVIYIERGFCQDIYYDRKEQKGALTPYLEKVFESLGYSKIKEENSY